VRQHSNLHGRLRTGYSSLSQIAKLPLDALRSTGRSLPHDGKCRAMVIVSTIITSPGPSKSVWSPKGGDDEQPVCSLRLVAIKRRLPVQSPLPAHDVAKLLASRSPVLNWSTLTSRCRMQIQSAVSPSKYFSVRASRQQGRNSLASSILRCCRGWRTLRHPEPAPARGRSRGARPALPAKVSCASGRIADWKRSSVESSDAGMVRQ